jgi:mRNA-degrading endonuclease RelE of RelBE toxin-antitoxin system
MSWNGSYASSFEKDLSALRAEIREKAVAAIRLGRDYRLVYSIYSHERLIDFEFVGDRKEAYRWIRHS